MVRIGYNVLKILAWGTDFAMIGRPLARMAITSDIAVKNYLDYVEKGFRSAMN